MIPREREPLSAARGPGMATPVKVTRALPKLVRAQNSSAGLHA